MTPATACSSFDIFDTVLTRTVGSPDAVHHVVGRRLRDEAILSVEASTFAAVRSDVPERLIDALGREATLAEIYDEVVRALGLPAAAAQVALRC